MENEESNPRSLLKLKEDTIIFTFKKSNHILESYTVDDSPLKFIFPFCTLKGIYSSWATALPTFSYISRSEITLWRSLSKTPNTWTTKISRGLIRNDKQQFKMTTMARKKQKKTKKIALKLKQQYTKKLLKTFCLHSLNTIKQKKTFKDDNYYQRMCAEKLWVLFFSFPLKFKIYTCLIITSYIVHLISLPFELCKIPVHILQTQKKRKKEEESWFSKQCFVLSSSSLRLC